MYSFFRLYVNSAIKHNLRNKCKMQYLLVKSQSFQSLIVYFIYYLYFCLPQSKISVLNNHVLN